MAEMVLKERMDVFMPISLQKDKMRFPNLQHIQKYILDGLKM